MVPVELPPVPPRRYRRRRRRKRTIPLSAAEAVTAALQKMGLTDQARRLRLFGAWNRAVGPRIAARTEPFGFSRGVLSVRTFSAAWQNELTFLKAELIEKLNEALDSKVVSDIRIMGGGGSKGRTKQKRNKRTERPKWLDVQARPEDLQAVRQTADVIGDPGIRSAFSHLMEVEKRARRVMDDTPAAYRRSLDAEELDRSATPKIPSEPPTVYRRPPPGWKRRR